MGEINLHLVFISLVMFTNICINIMNLIISIIINFL